MCVEFNAAPKENFSCAQANELGWVSIDLGHENCQQWPEMMDVAAPIKQSRSPGGGMPSAFRGDASGAALSPPPFSSDWQLLVDVEIFSPATPPAIVEPAEAAAWMEFCGIHFQSFL